ncbi:MAG: metallophosphoesterase [Methylovulum sp.]|uniref:metallophosphoesterase n=1 Tax=Methylovulum sp. TaxID=1916980 RepID=UPI002612D0AA|nr:metallophosphoesterase [Methylovulum sp.]MDD2725051.1 metallophosphoesterase [Methylovulum sp.]MDD5125793.1 metallophosphoesterase [Methylovulum sp.]
MNNKIKSLLIASAVVFSACSSIDLQAEIQTTPFSIALIGDLPYSDAKLIESQNLMEDLDAHKELSFIIHDGDFKGGSVPCDDKIYNDRLATFNQSTHPLFYVFGDNEWTDCHRAAAGGYNPFERLALLRSLFAKFSEPTSLGATKLPVNRQSEGFPENLRWFKNNVMFVGLHIPGSNNGLSTDPKYLDQAKAEYKSRNAANLRWLHNSFALATKRQSPGIMITIQANPWDFIPAQNLTGYEDFLVLLEQETRKFGKPVVLVHGDSHYFRIDKPFPSKLPSDVIGTDFPFIMPWESTANRLENFTRVETFGNPNSHWVKATIDVSKPSVFIFEQMIVEKNRVVTP